MTPTHERWRDKPDAITHQTPLIRLHRIRRARAQALTDAGHAAAGSSLATCGEYEHLVGCTHCGHMWWKTYHCNLRLCPLCARREAVIRGNYLTAMASQMKAPKLLSLTLRASDRPPRDTIILLKKYWAAFRRSPIGKQMTGGAYTIEMKRGAQHWHIHIHVLCDGPYLPRQLIFSTWGRITHNAVPEVDIRAATSAHQRRYVGKEVAKCAQLDGDPKYVAEWYEATHGQRIFGTFGAWHNATLRDILPDALPDSDPPPCPFCGTKNSTFTIARGFYVYGETWDSVKHHFTTSDGTLRKIPLIHKLLCDANPEQSDVTLAAAAAAAEELPDGRPLAWDAAGSLHPALD